MESSLSDASLSSSSRPEPSSEAHPLNSTPISSSLTMSIGSGPFTLNFNSQTLVVLARPEVLHCRFMEQNGSQQRFTVTVEMSKASNQNLTLKWAAQQPKNQRKLVGAFPRFPQDIPRETSWESVFKQCLNVLGDCFRTPSNSNVLKPPKSQGNSNAAQSFGQTGQSGSLMMEDSGHPSPLPAQPTDEVSPSPSVDQTSRPRPNVADHASGDPHASATLQSSNGIVAGVAQGQDIPQIPVANIPSGATSTVQAVDANGAGPRRSKRKTRPPQRLPTPPQTSPRNKRPAVKPKTSGGGGKRTKGNHTEQEPTPVHDDNGGMNDNNGGMNDNNGGMNDNNGGMNDNNGEEIREDSNNEDRGEPSRTTSGAGPSVGANGQASTPSIAEKVVSDLTPLLNTCFEKISNDLKTELTSLNQTLLTTLQDQHQTLLSTLQDQHQTLLSTLQDQHKTLLSTLRELLPPRAHSEAAVSPRVSTPSDVQEEQSEDRE